MSMQNWTANDVIRAANESLIGTRSITRREAIYIRARLKGESSEEAKRIAGYPAWMRGGKGGALGHCEALVKESKEVLAESVVSESLIDAAEVHEQLTEELRGDIADLYDEAGALLPIKDWPAWARQGGVEIIDAPNMVPSADGDGASWDQVGRKITIKLASRTKTRELALKLKAVDGLTKQGGDVTINNIQVTAERQRKVTASRARLARVVDVEPEPEEHT